MFGATFYVSIMLTISVYPSFCVESSISCTSDSANSIRVEWSLMEVSDYFVLSWYSLNEYRSIVGENATGFRDVVLKEHDGNINIFYGLDYAQAFEDMADTFGMYSYGYVISPGGEKENVIVTSGVLANNTYDVTVRITGRSSNITTLLCQVTTLTTDNQSSGGVSTTKSISNSEHSSLKLDPLILYVVIPGTVMSLLTITLLGILLNRNWRKKILRLKTPVRVIASRGSDVNSQVTVSIGYSSDSRPSSSESLLSWSKKNKVGIKSNITNRKRGRYRHYVITPAETFVPSPSPVLKPLLPAIVQDDSYDEDDPFDRLHHRHSLTTVTEESNSSDEGRRSGDRYARFSARTFDSRLTSRECSFVTYKSHTPNSRGASDFQWEQRYTALATMRRDNVWTSLSSHYGEGNDDVYARGSWVTGNHDSTLYDADNEFSHPFTEEKRVRGGRRRPWIERRQRRVTPSVLHVKPLLNPSESAVHVSEEGARLLGHSFSMEREYTRHPTPAVGVRRQGTPAVDQRNQFIYQSPHVRQLPQSTQRSSLRTTKSSRNILSL